MTLDADGHLWVVLGESGCVVQYDPADGSEIRRVKVATPPERRGGEGWGAREEHSSNPDARHPPL